MTGLAKNVAEERMRQEGRCGWRACSASDWEFPTTGPRAGGGVERYTARGALLFHRSDNDGGTSSLKGNSGSDTPPGDALAHEPSGYGTGARAVVFDLDGNAIGIAEVGKTTVYMDEGAT